MSHAPHHYPSITVRHLSLSAHRAALCTPLTGASWPALAAELDFILPQRPELFEWRLDLFQAFSSIQDIIDTGLRIRERLENYPLILTRRTPREGGHAIALQEQAVFTCYQQLAEQQVADILDWELLSPPDDIKNIKALTEQTATRLLLSHHNFAHTPSTTQLAGRLLAAQNAGADIAKIAVMPQHPDDTLTLLAGCALAAQSATIPLVAIAMGKSGAISRIVGAQYGSAITFAAGQQSSAPGQLTLQQLRDIWQILDQAT